MKVYQPAPLLHPLPSISENWLQHNGVLINERAFLIVVLGALDLAQNHEFLDDENCANDHTLPPQLEEVCFLPDNVLIGGDQHIELATSDLNLPWTTLLAAGDSLYSLS